MVIVIIIRSLKLGNNCGSNAGVVITSFVKLLLCLIFNREWSGMFVSLGSTDKC
jgi:hypothetical protein